MRATIAPALLLILAGCQQSDESDMTTVDLEGTAEPAVAPSDAAALKTGDGEPDPAAMANPVGSAIPAAVQGRWGLVPADCTSTRGNATGLLTIGPDTLRFYESVATLVTDRARSETMVRGEFEFTGEGQTWTRDVTLSVSGETLTRTERGGDQPGGTFTYTKCTA